MGDTCPVDMGDGSSEQLLHARPARHRWRHEPKLGLLIVQESERDIREVDAPHAIARLYADELAFERVVDSDHRALPPDATTGRDLPDVEMAGIVEGW